MDLWGMDHCTLTCLLGFLVRGRKLHECGEVTLLFRVSLIVGSVVVPGAEVK